LYTFLFFVYFQSSKLLLYNKKHARNRHHKYAIFLDKQAVFIQSVNAPRSVSQSEIEGGERERERVRKKEIEKEGGRESEKEGERE
jgi:hypothetical protein